MLATINGFLSRAAVAGGATIFLSGAAMAADIVVRAPWARATVVGASVGAVYFIVENKGATADRIVGASSDVAGRVEIHETLKQGGAMQMGELTSSLSIGAGKSVIFRPDSYRLMLIELKKQLLPGSTLHLTLKFDKAGDMKVDVPVESFGALGPPAARPAEKH